MYGLTNEMKRKMRHSAMISFRASLELLDEAGCLSSVYHASGVVFGKIAMMEMCGVISSHDRDVLDFYRCSHVDFAFIRLRKGVA